MGTPESRGDKEETENHDHDDRDFGHDSEHRHRGFFGRLQARCEPFGRSGA
jgi:hypothetical protein